MLQLKSIQCGPANCTCGAAAAANDPCDRTFIQLEFGKVEGCANTVCFPLFVCTDKLEIKICLSHRNMLYLSKNKKSIFSHYFLICVRKYSHLPEAASLLPQHVHKLQNQSIHNENVLFCGPTGLFHGYKAN